MFSFFLKGGPVMWPLLITSIITLTVVVERFLFLLHERAMRQPKIVEKIFTEVEAGNIEKAILLGDQSKDFVVNTLCLRTSSSRPCPFQRLDASSQYGITAFRPRTADP